MDMQQMIEKTAGNLPDYGRGYMVYDLETTGLDTGEARICQIAVTLIEAGKIKGSKVSLVNPGVPIPQEASAVHGINDSMVAEAPGFAKIAPKLAKTVRASILVGYNNDAYDDVILQDEFRRCDITMDLSTHPKIDLLRVWQLIEPRTLEYAVKKFLGLDFSDAHDAGADAEAVAGLAGAMFEQAGAPDKIDGLMDWQWPRQPGWMDRKGYAIDKEGVACVNFGKHKGTPIKELNAGYLDWLSRQDFPRDFINIVEKIHG